MDSVTAGHLILFGALGAAVWAAAASVLAARRKDSRLAASGRRALYSAAGLLFAAVMLLVISLLRRDFSLLYVANYISRSTPIPYTFAALWAGMQGSLLWWTLITSVYATTAIAVQWRKRADLVTVATATLGGIIAFFVAMLAFAANPFAGTSPIPADGAGLNPLLQSPFMTIHPVLLYLGLTGFSVPFAFSIASLVKGRIDGRWFTSTRRWTVLAWSFLTIGIILGAAWAYTELGWGGYWAWDPVENASLLPWLTGTAFLHSVMIQERRGMLKVWNVALVLTTYSLAIFGTFLTRSGIVTSVHTFSESPIGKYFLPFLGVLMLGAFALLGYRTQRLQGDRRIESALSREAMFLFNNMLFVALAFTVLWGTIYPVIVEAFRGAKISVGAPYFNSVATPIGLALLGLAGIGPLVAWRRASAASLRRHFSVPLFAVVATVALLFAAGVGAGASLLAFGLGAFVLTATASEFFRGARAHRVALRAHDETGGARKIGWGRALLRVVSRNRRRYGGYVVHVGVVLLFVGLAGGAFKQTWSGTVAPNQTFKIGAYSLTYRSSRVYATSEKRVNLAVLDVRRGGKPVGTLTPQRNFHLAQQQLQSEVGIRSTPAEDLYVVLTDMDGQRNITVRAWVNPLVEWIWIGGAVMALGMVVILSGKPSRETIPALVAASRREREAVRV
jgi:cytochrome c-type biogenesis protein CcmF